MFRSNVSVYYPMLNPATLIADAPVVLVPMGTELMPASAVARLALIAPPMRLPMMASRQWATAQVPTLTT